MAGAEDGAEQAGEAGFALAAVGAAALEGDLDRFGREPAAGTAPAVELGVRTLLVGAGGKILVCHGVPSGIGAARVIL